MLTEAAIIARIRAAAHGHRAVRLGIGDDCAILDLPPSDELLVTTDFCLEGTHFRRDLHPPRSAGHRCLARGLSDIAAMGGTPIAAFLSLAVPADLEPKWLNGFLDGLLAPARHHNISLAGGDTTRSANGVLVDIIVLGRAPRGTALRRSGARPGDRIYVTGELGAAAATIHSLLAGKRIAATRSDRHFFPEPRLALGELVRAKKLATSCADLSDGLSTDLNHICEESDVAALIYADHLPIAPNARRAANPLDLALNGGEDYELLFTAPPRTHLPKRLAGVRITAIGEIVHAEQGKPRTILVESGTARGLAPAGWEPFKNKKRSR